jgi:ABC-type branched-subunit amino acid transport system substrate-binding protein
MKFPVGASNGAVALVGGAIVVASMLTVSPQFQDKVVGVAAGPDGPVIPDASQDPHAPGATKGPDGKPIKPGATVGPDGQPVAGQSNQPGAVNPGNLACAPGRNGGATDVGVTATQIKLASTVAESGLASSFLGDARFGMLAVIRRVNAAGGICGRTLDLNLVDDGWNRQTGQTDIRNFIHGGYFALAVVPSSEGLDAASRSGDIDQAKIPVVGTDGMLYSQYSDPWIWPVATSTISTAHIAASEAYKAGSRTFGLVYDSDYKFGKEGAAAFRGAIARMPGAKLMADTPVQSGQQDYGSQVQQFEQGCHPCDETFMLLEPDTATAWINSDASADHYVFGNKRTDGPQPLFTSGFARSCGPLCNNMWVWTGYQAPYPPFSSLSPNVGYVNSIRAISSAADVANQFLEGSYLGMELLVEALRQVGPNLTRDRLKEVLDSMTFKSGLTEPERWRPGDHLANASMLGFTVQYSGGFNGFQYQNTGWVKDQWRDLDHPSGS